MTDEATYPCKRCGTTRGTTWTIGGYGGESFGGWYSCDACIAEVEAADDGRLLRARLQRRAKRARRGDVTQRTRYAVLERDGFRCVTCGAAPPAVAIELDHVVPVSRGGANTPDNLRTLCMACNRGKAASL